MKKFLLATIFFTIISIGFSTPSFAVTPTPTAEPLPINNTPCDGTVYPPNSTCYDKVENVENLGINPVDSNEALLSYPLSCISAPSITYRETFVGNISSPLGLPVLRNVTINTDVSAAQLGFLGPDSTTLNNTNPDKIAQKYLFNALFDRPGADPEAPRESFRTYWRMLDSLSQAQLKAYFIEKTTNHTFYYVGQDKKQHEVKVDTAWKNKLPVCLKTFGLEVNNFIIDCWKNGRYYDQYTKLGQDNPQVQEEYDALLPFNFDNARGYISSGLNVSEENIPYLKAIISGLKGDKTSLSSTPGLFDFYTPSWTNKNIAKYPTTPNEIFQYPLILLIAANPQLNDNCLTPTDGSSLSSPKTYPNNPTTTQNVVVSATPQLVSSTPDQCVCRDPNSYYCYAYYRCNSYSNNETSCNSSGGCNFIKGQNVYELTGTAVGKPITVLNNPYVTTLTDLIIGGKPLFPNASKFPLTETARQIINFVSDKILNPVQPSFYKMLLPDSASESASPKKLVSAPSVSTSATSEITSATVTVDGADTINRESNLAQDAMHLLQNCWLVPSDQQVSAKCGRKVTVPVGECALSAEPLTGSCSKASFAQYAVGLTSPLTSFIPLVTPELSAVYAEAERETGVSCVILAAIHSMEAGNNACQSLISGRKIGDPEPDNGGATYSTLLETAIAAGEEFAGKLAFARGRLQNDLGRNPTGFEALTTAFSFYNGGGNSNCLSNPPASNYGSCPPLFKGEDDPYPLSRFDQRHATMYLRCLKDNDCSSAVLFTRPGAFSVALNYYNSLP